MNEISTLIFFKKMGTLFTEKSKNKISKIEKFY